MRDAPKRNAETLFRYTHANEVSERILTPKAELKRRLEESWAEGAPNPIESRVDRDGVIRVKGLGVMSIPSHKDRKVYVVFERDTVGETGVRQRVLVYGQKPGSKQNAEVNYLLWEGTLSPKRGRLVSSNSAALPRRLVGKERYQLQAWLSWNLEYIQPPKSGPSLTQEEIAYQTAEQLSQKAMTFEELHKAFLGQKVSKSKLTSALAKMMRKEGFGGYRIADAGSGRYGLLYPLTVGKGNIIHPFRSHYRFSHSRDLEGQKIWAMFEDKKLLQLTIDQTEEVVSMKHQWDFDGKLLWSGASHPPAQFQSFTFSGYEVPRTQKTSVSTAEQRYRIPGKAGEVIAGVLINGELRRVDWFQPGTLLHNVYKITADGNGYYQIQLDQDLKAQPVRFIEAGANTGSLPVELMTAAVFGSLRSEVRTLSGNLFEDEREAHAKWERGFEKERRLRGVVLQAAVEHRKLRVRSLVREFGLYRRETKKILEEYGFQKKPGTNGPYEYTAAIDALGGPEVQKLSLPEKVSEFLRYDVVSLASEIISKERVYLPEGLLDQESTLRDGNAVFWRALSPGLARLFQPLTGENNIAWSQLQALVKDLFSGIQVLRDLQQTPLNAYHEPRQALTADQAFAAALSQAALESSKQSLFSERDAPRLKQLQLELERLHFQSAKVLIEYERSIASARSEIRYALGGRADSITRGDDDGVKTAMIRFSDLLTFTDAEIRETAIVMKQRSEVRFVIYETDPAHPQILRFKQIFSFRNIDWVQSSAEEAYQALGPKYKQSGVVGFSREDARESLFSAESRKKIRQYKLIGNKTGIMAAALSFDPEDPRYRWEFLRDGDFYIITDALTSIAAGFLNQFAVAMSA